jgi:hypothetical protein
MAPSPDRAAGEDVAADAVPSSSHDKRDRDEATTTSESRKVTKVGRLTHVDETKTQEEETPDTTPTPNVEEEEGDVQENPAASTTENIVDLLSDLFDKNRTVVEEALSDLDDLCDDLLRHDETVLSQQANEREIRRLGGHMAVVHAVKKHVDHGPIQREGIRALCNFTRSPLSRVLVGDVGGVKVILAGMRRHPKNETIQALGCGAIANLLIGTKRNAERFEESDGIAAVIAAMKAHAEDEDVQYNSCYALLRMCEWAEYRPLIIAAGGAATIAHAMKEYIGSPRVHVISHRAMQKLVICD